MQEPPPDLRGLSLDDLRRAVDVYLAVAYGPGELPPAVRRRLEWPACGDAAQLVSAAPFEKTSKPGSPLIHALRLGNRLYPHMKLQVQPWDTPAGYMLSVNTHDQVLGLDPMAADSDAFRTLQAENATIKEAIDAAWDAAGFPTFARYLRDYLSQHPSGE